MNTVFEIVVNLYQGFLMIFFMHLRLPTNHEVRWWIDALFIGIIGCILSLYLFPWMTIPDTYIVIVPFIYCVVTKRGSWGQRLLWSIVLVSVFSYIATISYNIYTRYLNVDMFDLFDYGPIRVGMLLTTNTATTVTLVILAKIGHREEIIPFGLSGQIVLVLTLLLELFSIELIYYYLMQTDSTSIALLLISLCIFGLMILTILLYEILTQAAKNKLISEMRLQVLSLDLAHQKEMAAFYDEMLAVQHDLNKQLDTAKQLIAASSDVDRDAVMALLKVDKPLSIRYITGNTTVDALLTAKHALMEQYQIDFSLQPYPLQVLPIDSPSFCILLSNILDNAIEAVQRITDSQTEKKIELQFARSWNVFYLTCINTMNPSTITRYGERFISSKEDKRIHGFGVSSIRQIVEDNGGTCEISTDKCQFRIDVLLPGQNDSAD